VTDKELAVDDALTGEVVPSLDRLVEEWKAAEAAAENATWAKADVALAAAPTEDNYGLIKEFAERVGVPHNTIRQYRMVARNWPQECGRPHSFSIAVIFNALDDRYELVASKDYTVIEARELVRSRRQPPPLPSPAPAPTPGNRDDDEETRRARQAWRNVCQAAEAVTALPVPAFGNSEKQMMIRQLEAALAQLREMQ
jgi:hypothetical protein